MQCDFRIGAVAGAADAWSVRRASLWDALGEAMRLDGAIEALVVGLLNRAGGWVE